MGNLLHEVQRLSHLCKGCSTPVVHSTYWNITVVGAVDLASPPPKFPKRIPKVVHLDFWWFFDGGRVFKGSRDIQNTMRLHTNGFSDRFDFTKHQKLQLSSFLEFRCISIYPHNIASSCLCCCFAILFWKIEAQKTKGVLGRLGTQMTIFTVNSDT